MKIFLLFVFALFFTAASVNDARKANEAYENGNYERAAELYRQAIEQNPDDPRLYFNLGNSLYQMGRADEAKEAFDRYKNLAESREERSMADYNIGRMLIDNEQYQEASEYFREALKNNPSDADARHNYELALRRQQEQEQEQQQQSESGDNDNQEQDQNQDGESQDNNQQQDENGEEESGQQPQSPQNQDGNEGEGDEEQQPANPRNISPEEAENILRALAQLERELLENQKKEATETPSNNEQDW